MRIIVAEMRAAVGKREELIKLLNGMLEPSRAESGCLRYRYFSSQEDPDLFHFFEEWRDADAVENHFASAHFRDLEERLSPLVQETPSLRIFEATVVEP